MARAPVNDKIVQAAQELLKGPSAYRDTLRRIVNGKVKSVDVDWWREENGVAPGHVSYKSKVAFEKKLATLKAMADPARSPNEHVRREAEAAFARVQAAGPPKPSHTRSAPGLEEYDRQEAQRRAEGRARMERMDEAIKAARARRDAAMRNAAVNTTKSKPEPKPEPVNTTTSKPGPSVNTTKAKSKPEPSVNTTTAKKPRSADRHLEPNRDRHRPGYMVDYMRRWRAEEAALRNSPAAEPVGAFNCG
jgi:hypothetical protein